MNNVLFCSVGRRSRLLHDFKQAEKNVTLIATDCSPYAPGLYAAHKAFIAPRIDEAGYLDFILRLCKKENVSAITTLIDPEITLLAQNRSRFLEQGILPLCPDARTAAYCFDKFSMYEYLTQRNIPTVLTYKDLKSFEAGLALGEISFPVFVKPRTGSGSVGATSIKNPQELSELWESSPVPLIIQEYMAGDDLGADVYVDCISRQTVAIFGKKKLESRIGGANKTISIKDNSLFDFVKNIVAQFDFYGPIDLDIFHQNGAYYLLEINPRFGGGYLHAYGAGVDFYHFILNNIRGVENPPQIGRYAEEVIMMMYDDVIIKHQSELIEMNTVAEQARIHKIVEPIL